MPLTFPLSFPMPLKTKAAVNNLCLSWRKPINLDWFVVFSLKPCQTFRLATPGWRYPSAGSKPIDRCSRCSKKKIFSLRHCVSTHTHFPLFFIYLFFTQLYFSHGAQQCVMDIPLVIAHIVWVDWRCHHEWGWPFKVFLGALAAVNLDNPQETGVSLNIPASLVPGKLWWFRLICKKGKCCFSATKWRAFKGHRSGEGGRKRGSQSFVLFCFLGKMGLLKIECKTHN